MDIESPIILLSIALAVILTIVVTVVLLNVRRPCADGKYSVDGMGSLMNQCQDCDDLEDELDIVKGLTAGSYQCDLGQFDKSVAKGINGLVSLVNDPKTALEFAESIFSTPSSQDANSNMD
jgi:hypothetical protein